MMDTQHELDQLRAENAALRKHLYHANIGAAWSWVQTQEQST